MSEIVLSFVIEFADNLPREGKQGDGKIVSQLFNWLTDTSFEMNVFKKYLKSIVACNNVTTRNMSDFMEDGGLYRALVRGDNATKNGCGTLYAKDVTEVDRKKIAF